jgi:hypothetical protein
MSNNPTEFTRNPDAPRPPAGFDPTSATEFVNVSTDRFTQVPKASHREGPHKVASITGVGLLTLYLSNKTGWKIPNAEKLATQYKEGAARIRDALADLEEAGWLVRFPMQVEGGFWRTFTFVSNDPAELDEYRRYKAELEAARVAQGKAPTSSKAPRAATKKKATGGDKSTFSQVGPDRSNGDSVDRHPVDGVPVDRDAADRNPETVDLKEQETTEEIFEETKNPPPLSAVSSLPREASPSQGGDLSDTEKRLLSAAVQQAVEARAGDDAWSQQAIVDAMRKQLDAGQSPAKVATAMIAAATDPTTNYPGRIGHLLKVGATAGAAKATADVPEWAQGPFKHMAPETPRCRRHRGEPEIGCGRCKADAIAARLGEQDAPVRPEEAEGITGAALARKIAAASKSGAKVRAPRFPKVEPSTTPPPSALGELLGAAAAAIGGAA